ncbi:MAG: cation diffusion facilitator family transporter, partial [Planctomycetota bacterium]
MEDRLSIGTRASSISLAVNGGLALVKLVAGIAGNSYALIADAIESLGDIISSAIVWGGLVIAARPADSDHPYGHGKAEPLAALAVSLMLLGAAATIAVQAVQEIRTPHHAPASYTLIVLLAVVAIKETMFRY